jgi:hypothetical protein
MKRRLVTIAMAALSVPALGLAAYSTAYAVSASPAPQVVIPASLHVSGPGADDPATHEADHVSGADDPATHDANDISGRGRGISAGTARPTAPVATKTAMSHRDDGPNHDAVDDGSRSSGRGR